MFEFVSATRSSLADFRKGSALARSLQRILPINRHISARVTSDNTTGLPILYNRAIESSTAEYLIFVHDDVWIDDYFLPVRIADGLERFDVIGAAGSASYALEGLVWYESKVGRSGAVGHGPTPFGRVSLFGKTPAECAVLDGVLMAAKTETLRRSGVRFDEQFAFHFYDLDFCLTARQAGLKVGTWPLAITHQSEGVFGSEAWDAASKPFAAKWSGKTTAISA